MNLIEHTTFGFEVVRKSGIPQIIEQVHQAKIIEITSLEHRSELIKKPISADGLFTRHPNLELYIFTADCLPLIFFSKEPKGPIAAIHCGWRGARLEIARKALTLFRSYAKNVHVALGPAIRGCCYEIKDDLIETFEKKKRTITPFIQIRNGKKYFDIPNYIIESQLFDVDQSQLHLTSLRCTYCSNPQLPSFRRTEGKDPQIRTWVSKGYTERRLPPQSPKQV